MLNPSTGESVRTETICHIYDWKAGRVKVYFNAPTYEHDLETTINNGIEYESTCRKCGYSIYASR